MLLNGLLKSASPILLFAPIYQIIQGNFLCTGSVHLIVKKAEKINTLCISRVIEWISQKEMWIHL